MIAYEVTLEGMGSYFRRFLALDRAARRRTMEKVAKMLQAEAKSILGSTAVEAAGPYAAWAPLAEATVKERARLGYSPDQMLLRTGELRNAIEATWSPTVASIGVPDKVVGGSAPGDHPRNIGQVAVVHELGDEHTPPRSFLGMAGARRANQVAEMMAKHFRYSFREARVESGEY